MLRLYDLSNNEIIILRSQGSYVQGEANNIVLTTEISGLKELSFVLPLYYTYNGIQVENERWTYIQNEMLVKYTPSIGVTDWFKIKSTEDQHADKGTLISNIQCKHISYDLNKKGFDKVIDMTDTPTNIMSEILEDTGWSIGTIDTTLNAKIRTLEISSKSNVLEMLNTIAELFKGYLNFNGDDKTIDLLVDIGDVSGEVSFRYRKNLKDIKRVTNTESIVTRLYAYGGEDSSGIIGISSVNPNKQAFIQNFDYFIDSGLMSSASTPTITQYDVDMLAVNTNISDTQTLITFESTSIITKQAQVNAKKIQVTSLTQLIAEIDGKLPLYDSGSTEYTTMTNERIAFNSDLSILNGEIIALEGEITTHNNNILAYTTTLNGYITQKAGYETQFKIDLGDFIFEGIWQDTNYVSATPTELYNDAVELLKKSCYPTITYTLGIVDLSSLTGHSLESFNLGDRIYVYDELLKINTSLKITKIVQNLDKPQETKFEISNINTAFQDLFKSIVNASNTLNKNKEEWNRAKTAIDAGGGSINSTALQETINNNDINLFFGSGGTTSTNGLVFSNTSDTNLKLRIDDCNMFVSVDGGTTWKSMFMIYDDDGTPKIGFNLGDYARGGRLDVSQVAIYGGSENTTFYWNKYGLYATDSATPTQKYIVFNKDGLKATNDGGLTYVFEITSDGRAYFRDTIELPNAGLTNEGSLDSSIRIWAGNTYANRATAPFRVQQDGHMFAKDATIESALGTKMIGNDGILQSWGDSIVDNVDTTHKLRLDFYVPDTMVSIKTFNLHFRLLAFRAYETGAASGGSQTTNSGYDVVDATSVSYTANEGGDYDIVGSGLAGSHTHGGAVAADGTHQHDIYQPKAHSHTIQGHGHSMQGHTHDIPAHSHGITYGIYESTSATGVKVYVDGTLRLDNGGAGYTTDQHDLDLKAWITTTRWHYVELESSQLGRINAAYFAQMFLNV